MNQLYDKNLRPVRKGDILKVFHFVGSRNKKHYMFKMAWEYKTDGGKIILMACHLNEEMISEGAHLGNSYRLPEGPVLNEYEIVQGFACVGDELSFEDRPKYTGALNDHNDLQVWHILPLTIGVKLRQ